MNNSPLADPFDLILQMKPGIMIHGVAGPAMDQMSFVFLIREDDKYIKKLGKYPNINVRMGIFSDLAILFMIRFENNSDLTYDCWVNYHDAYTKFNLLKTQDELVFQFYNSRECLRTLAINNKFKNQLQAFDVKVINKPAWSMQEFDALKSHIYDQYQPGELWNLLLLDKC